VILRWRHGVLLCPVWNRRHLLQSHLSGNPPPRPSPSGCSGKLLPTQVWRIPNLFAGFRIWKSPLIWIRSLIRIKKKVLFLLCHLKNTNFRAQIFQTQDLEIQIRKFLRHWMGIQIRIRMKRTRIRSRTFLPFIRIDRICCMG